jgi:hypothetical protein
MSCGAPEQGPGAGVESVGTTGQAVIQGRTVRDGVPVAAAYVRLLDRSGDFTAEVVSGPGGEFRFFPAPGQWTVRALAPGSAGDQVVEATAGVIDLELSLAAF